jgi:tetratricopeptide (TPR) repeat protein
MILSDQRSFESAAGEFARAVELDGTNDDAILGLGQAQLDLHLPAEAERTYRAAIDSRPGYFGTHVWAARFYRRQSRYEDMGRELESAIALVPRHGPLNAGLVPPLAYTGRYDEALAAAEKAIAITPTRQAFVAKSMTLFRMHRFDEAAVAAENARKIGPTDSTLLTALARSHYWIGTIEARSRASALYREAAKELETGSSQRSNPMSKVDQCLSLAEIYAKLERPDDARAQLQLAGLNPASTERPTDSHQLFFGALVYAQIGDSDAALRWLERAIYWGVPVAELRAWPELDGLRNQQAFRALDAANINDSKR